MTLNLAEIFDPTELNAYERCMKEFQELAKKCTAQSRFLDGRQWLTLTLPARASGFEFLCPEGNADCWLPADEQIVSAASKIRNLGPCPLTALYILKKHRYVSRGHAGWTAGEMGIPLFVTDILTSAADGVHHHPLHENMGKGCSVIADTAQRLEKIFGVRV